MHTWCICARPLFDWRVCCLACRLTRCAVLEGRVRARLPGASRPSSWWKCRSGEARFLPLFPCLCFCLDSRASASPGSRP